MISKATKIAIALATGAGAATAMAAVAGLIRLDSPSSIKLSRAGDFFVGESTTASFEVVNVFADNQPHQILFKKIITSEIKTGDAVANDHLLLEARLETPNGFDKVAWTLNEDSLSAAYDWDRFIVTSKAGCCASVAGQRAYDPMTGRLIFSYGSFGDAIAGTTVPPFSASIPNSGGLVRYLGVTTSYVTRDWIEETLPAGQQKFASVVYSDGAKILQTVDVFSPPPTPGMGVSVDPTFVDLTGDVKTRKNGNRLELWALDGQKSPKAISGFGIQMDVAVPDIPEAQVLIVVDQDRISTAKSVLPRGYSLRIRP